MEKTASTGARGAAAASSGPRRIATYARESALIGAAVGAVSEAVAAGKELSEGEIDARSAVGRVLNKAGSAGGTTVARAAAAYGLREGVKEVAKRVGADTLRRLASTGPATAIAFAGVNQILDTTQLARDKIDRSEYGTRTVQNAGATGGGLGGAAVGAAIGSIVPGAGTAIGALLGGIAGGMAGARSGRVVGERIFRKEPSEDAPDDDPSK